MAHFGVPPADVSPEVRGVAFKTLSGTDTSQESYVAANLGQATGSDHSWVRRLAACITLFLGTSLEREALSDIKADTLRARTQLQRMRGAGMRRSFLFIEGDPCRFEHVRTPRASCSTAPNGSRHVRRAVVAGLARLVVL